MSKMATFERHILPKSENMVLQSQGILLMQVCVLHLTNVLKISRLSNPINLGFYKIHLPSLLIHGQYHKVEKKKKKVGLFIINLNYSVVFLSSSFVWAFRAPMMLNLL